MGSRRSTIFGVPFYLRVHPLSQNYQIPHGNTYEEVFFFVLKWSATPHPKGRGTSTPQFLEFLSIYPYVLCRRTTKFHKVTCMGTGLVFTWSATLPPQGGGGRRPGAPNFGVPFYTYVYTGRIRIVLIPATPEDISFPATTASITLITVSWS